MAGRLIPLALVAGLALATAGRGASAQQAGVEPRAASSNPVSAELAAAPESAAPGPAKPTAAAAPAPNKPSVKTAAPRAEDVARMQRVARRLAADGSEAVPDLESARPLTAGAGGSEVKRAPTAPPARPVAPAPQEGLALGQSVHGKPVPDAAGPGPAAAGLLQAPVAPSLPPGVGAAKGVPGASSVFSGWVQTTAALIVVLALILGLRSVAMRWLGTPAAGRNPAIEVLARVPVAARQHVLLLRAGRRVLLVGDSPAGGLRTLADISDPEEVGSILQSVAASKPQSVSQGFGQLLQRINGRYDDEHHLALAEGGDEREFAVDSARDQVRKLLARVRSFGRKGGGTP